MIMLFRLRSFNSKLFADVSRLIFSIIKEFYKEAAGKETSTGMVISHQTFGDMLRWNPHFHCLVLEGGFDDEGNFVYIPSSDLKKMTAWCCIIHPGSFKPHIIAV